RRPLGPVAAGPIDRDRAELHAVGRMLQMMEDAWISLGLRRYSALPMNRGWLNTFRRWGSTEAFRRHWPTLRSEFSSDFVQFCESQLNLPTSRPTLMPLPGPVDRLSGFEGRAVDLLAREFWREWPDVSRDGYDIPNLLIRAADLQQQANLGDFP